MDCRNRLLASLTKTIERLIDYQFKNEVNSMGRKWTPLKPSTLKRKRSGRKLYETGRMRNSIKIRKEGNERIIISAISYARYHLSGTRRFPPRPWGIWNGTSPFEGSRWAKEFSLVIDKELRECLKREFRQMKGVKSIIDF